MPDPLPDHYEALKLRVTATQQEIKAAYKKLALLYHPDRNRDDEEATKKFQTIQAAYEVLNDVQKRTQYDRLRMHTPSIRVRMSTSQPKAPTAPTARQYESARARMREEQGRASTGYGYRAAPAYGTYDPYGSRSYQRPPDSESSTRAHSGHSTTASGWSKTKATEDFGYGRERKASTSNPKMGTHKGNNNIWSETPDERTPRRSPPLRREGASSTGPHVGAGHYAYMQDRARSRGASPQPWQERTSAPYSFTPGEKYSYSRPSPPPAPRTREPTTKKKSSRDTPSSGRRTDPDSGDDDSFTPAFQRHATRSKPKARPAHSYAIPISSDEDSDDDSFGARKAKAEKERAKAKTRPTRASTTGNPPPQNPDYLSSSYNKANGTTRATRVPSPSYNMPPQRPSTYSQPHGYQAHQPPSGAHAYAPHAPPPPTQSQPQSQTHQRSDGRPGLQPTFSYDPLRPPNVWSYRMDSRDDSFNLSDDYSKYNKAAPPPSQQPSFSQFDPKNPFNFASTGTRPSSETPPIPPPAAQHSTSNGLYGDPLNKYGDFPGNIPAFGSADPSKPTSSQSQSQSQSQAQNSQPQTPSQWTPEAWSAFNPADWLSPNSNSTPFNKKSEPNLRSKGKGPIRTNSVPRFEDLSKNLNLDADPTPTSRAGSKSVPPPTAEESQERTTGNTRKSVGRESVQPMDIDPPTSNGPNIVNVEPPMSPGQSSSVPPPSNPTINIQPINPTQQGTESPIKSPIGSTEFTFQSPLNVKLNLGESFPFSFNPVATKTGSGPQAPRTAPIPQTAFAGAASTNKPPASATASTFNTADLKESLFSSKGFAADLADTLPFKSKAAANINLPDEEDELVPLKLVAPQKPPSLPEDLKRSNPKAIQAYNEYYNLIQIYIKAYQIWEGTLVNQMKAVVDETGSFVSGLKEVDDDEELGKKDKTFVTGPDLLDGRKKRRLMQKLADKKRIREHWDKHQIVFENTLATFYEVREWLQTHKQ